MSLGFIFCNIVTGRMSYPEWHTLSLIVTDLPQICYQQSGYHDLLSLLAISAQLFAVGSGGTLTPATGCNSALTDRGEDRADAVKTGLVVPRAPELTTLA
jgi:hypothetical protein